MKNLLIIPVLIFSFNFSIGQEMASTNTEEINLKYENIYRSKDDYKGFEKKSPYDNRQMQLTTEEKSLREQGKHGSKKIIHYYFN